MKQSEKNSTYSKYYRITSSSNFEIEKENIFYRNKYNDIINYLKGMLINDEYSTIQQYLKPKGLLLININPGTDILDYLHLISKNYYLDVIELNYLSILKKPLEFIDNLNLIIQDILNDIESKYDNREGSSSELYEGSDKTKPKKLLIINQSEFSDNLFNGKSVLKAFLNFNLKHEINYLNKGIILIWISEKIGEIKGNSSNIFKIFDLFIKIPPLKEAERETVLKNFSEKNPKIVFDIQSIMDFTKNWEVLDLNNLLKMGIFKHFLNSDLNNKSNEITDIMIDLIKSGEFIPSGSHINQNYKIIDDNNNLSFISQKNEARTVSDKNRFNLGQIKSILKNIQEQPISEFMLSQLYEDAASKNYTELVLIIDKLNKKEILEDNDRKLLAKYPFIMNDSPNTAQVNLEKAKKRIDHINQSFGKS